MHTAHNSANHGIVKPKNESQKHSHTTLHNTTQDAVLFRLTQNTTTTLTFFSFYNIKYKSLQMPSSWHFPSIFTFAYLIDGPKGDNNHLSIIIVFLNIKYRSHYNDSTTSAKLHDNLFKIARSRFQLIWWRGCTSFERLNYQFDNPTWRVLEIYMCLKNNCLVCRFVSLSYRSWNTCLRGENGRWWWSCEGSENMDKHVIEIN